MVVVGDGGESEMRVMVVRGRLVVVVGDGGGGW